MQIKENRGRNKENKIESQQRHRKKQSESKMSL